MFNQISDCENTGRPTQCFRYLKWQMMHKNLTIPVKVGIVTSIVHKLIVKMQLLLSGSKYWSAKLCPFKYCYGSTNKSNISTRNEYQLSQA